MKDVTNALAQSSTCSICGTRMWPAEQLKAHVLRHQLRDLVYAGELAKVQKTFRSMRFPGDKRDRKAQG